MLNRIENRIERFFRGKQSRELKELTREHGIEATISSKLLGDFEEIANRHHTTTIDVFRKITGAGLILVEAEEAGSDLIIRDKDGRETILKVFNSSD